MQNRQIYRDISLHPETTQFFIDELPLLFVSITGLVYGGMEGVPLGSIATLFAVLLFLCLAYRLIYLRRIRYHIGSEQLTAEHGVFQRSTDYIELYRVVDFHEHQPLLQQIFGLKTVDATLHGQNNTQTGSDWLAQTNSHRRTYQGACRV